MKYVTRLLFLVSSLASAQVPAVVSRQVVVQTGPVTAVTAHEPQPPPSPPISVEAGADLKILPLAPGGNYGPVQWYKEGKPLAQNAETLEITSVAASDSGVYSCDVLRDTKGNATRGFVAIFVAGNTTQRLLNFSTLATIGLSQPIATVGFVVEAGPAASPVLVRAVGPTLKSFGVAGPLALPSLELLDAQGNHVLSYPYPVVSLFGAGSASGTAVDAGNQVGAFQLIPGSRDAAELYYLSPGSYTVRVASGDGAGGTVLVEVYEAPY